MEKNEKLKLLFSVTEDGNRPRVIAYLNERGIRFHTALQGEGTAPTEMLDLLGIGTSAKDVTLSFGTESAMARLCKELDSRLGGVRHARGIFVILPLNAISNLFSTIVIRQAAGKGTETMEETFVSENAHTLICAAVKRGYAEQAAEAARKAGASGGTVLRGRLSGAEDVAKFFGSVLSDEREIVTILTTIPKRAAIMTALNTACGLHTPAEGLVLSLPVDRAYKF